MMTSDQLHAGSGSTESHVDRADAGLPSHSAGQGFMLQPGGGSDGEHRPTA